MKVGISVFVLVHQKKKKSVFVLLNYFIFLKTFCLTIFICEVMYKILNNFNLNFFKNKKNILII